MDPPDDDANAPNAPSKPASLPDTTTAEDEKPLDLSMRRLEVTTASSPSKMTSSAVNIDSPALNILTHNRNIVYLPPTQLPLQFPEHVRTNSLIQFIQQSDVYRQHQRTAAKFDINYTPSPQPRQLLSDQQPKTIIQPPNDSATQEPIIALPSCSQEVRESVLCPMKFDVHQLQHTARPWEQSTHSFDSINFGRTPLQLTGVPLVKDEQGSGIEMLMQCVLCRTKFSSRTYFEEHIRDQCGGITNKCYICKQNCRSLSSLKRHLAYHRLKQRFQCAVCHKTFSIKANLLVHLRTHTGEKPFSCGLCGIKFTTKQQYEEHLSRRHLEGGQPPTGDSQAKF